MNNPGLIVKRGCILALFISLCMGLQAQTADGQPKPKNDEIGVDVLGFIRPIFSAPNNMFNHTPNYYITYRHYFKKFNLRMGLGGIGVYSDRKILDGLSGNYKVIEDVFLIDYRIGAEWAKNMGTKWQIFYGADFRPSFYYAKFRVNQEGGNARFSENIFTQFYGVAPILGFRYKITDRFSVTCETSVAFNFQVIDYTTHTDYVDPNIPDENRTLEKSFRFYTSYYQPVTFTLTYAL